jgi:16S rRNA (adenine1518-N6/adenine1519-N6)-dimethyltransferase
LGVLTIELARRTAGVAAVEIDPACVRALALTLRGLSSVRIVEGDILQQTLGALMAPPYRVAGNIPYSLTGALFPRLLEQPALPRRIDLVLQREVAERLAAPPGAWSLATLGVRVYGHPQLVLTIPRQAFYPQPKVDSALLRIAPEEHPALPRSELPAFFRFARPFFQARRKQLPYSMVRGWGIGNADARTRLKAVGIDPTRRAETLSLEEWGRLFHAEHLNWTWSG